MIRQVGEAFENYRNRIKEDARRLKEYLRGRVIQGTEVWYAPKKVPIIGVVPCLSRKQRQHRKVRNKMARASRRINRLRG